MTSLAVLDARRNYTRPDWFCKDKHITGPSAGVRRNLSRINDPGDRVTKHDLLIINTVTAYQCDSIFDQSLEATTHDVAENCRVHAFLWKARNRQCRQRSARHGPYIIDGADRRNSFV